MIRQTFGHMKRIVEREEELRLKRRGITREMAIDQASKDVLKKNSRQVLSSQRKGMRRSGTHVHKKGSPGKEGKQPS